MAKAMVEVLDLTDTSRNGETRTQVKWNAAIDLYPWMKPTRPIAERLLVRTWGNSLEALQNAVLARR